MADTRHDRTVVPRGAPSWITKELIEDTLRVWGPKYEQRGETLTPDDALEILINVTELYDVLNDVGAKQANRNESCQIRPK